MRTDLWRDLFKGWNLDSRLRMSGPNVLEMQGSLFWIVSDGYLQDAVDKRTRSGMSGKLGKLLYRSQGKQWYLTGKLGA